MPNNILFDKNLSDKQKLLYCYISSLCAEKWYCWASNKYIWQKLWVNETTISTHINILGKLWYIEIQEWSNQKRKCLLKNQNTPFEKSKAEPFEKSKDNNIIYNNINKNILSKDNIIYNITNNNINNNDEKNNEMALLDINKEKEKSSAKKEKESFWNVEINEFIEKIREKCNSLWIMYDKTKEREFSRHILTAREFWENSTKCWMTRTDFSINILIASIKIWYFKWPCNWPMKIYQNYADVYNKTVMRKWSGGWIVHIDV